jgi:homoserine dehydrogenase
VSQVNVGICGLGTVGGGTFNVLRRNSAVIADRAGARIEVTHIATRSDNPAYDTAGIRMSRDVFEVARNPEIDILVESMGGTDIAFDLVMEAIKQGKHIVTANKALIAERGNEIFAAAGERGVAVAYEAAVAGGIPIIQALRDGLSANKINWLAGIINGTSNFILTEMRDKGKAFASVLKEAQKLGYAEADPTFDVEGIDAAHKLVILASIAFGIPLQFDRIYTQGISRIKNEDVVHAGELGFVIKHLGIARRGVKGIELRVHPTLIPKDRLIAKVDGVMNAVMIEGDAVGPTLYFGAGAGAEPTASSVIANLIEIAHQKDVAPEARSSYLGVPMHKLKDTPVVDIEDCETSFYLRFTAADKPGVLNKITQLLSNAELSVEAIQQKEPISGSAEATIVMVTHKAVESELRKVVSSLEKLDVITSKVVYIRVEDLD